MSASSSAAGLARAADHDGRRLRADLGLDLFHQLHRRNIGQAKIEHDAVQILLLHHRQGFAAGSHRENLHIASAQQLPPVVRGGLRPAATISSFLVRRSSE